MKINEFRSLFPDEETCRQYLEQTVWHQGRTSPHCKCQQSWTLSGSSVRKGLYDTVTTKTPLHATKLSLRPWLMAMYFMLNSSKGVSSVFLAKWLGIRQKAAWKVGHAVRALLKLQGDAIDPLQGAVDLDENCLGGKPRFVQGITNPRGKGTRKSRIHVAVV